MFATNIERLNSLIIEENESDSSPSRIGCPAKDAKGTRSASVSEDGANSIVEVTDRCQVGTLCHVRRPIQSFVHSEISCLLSFSSPFNK